MTYVIIAVVVVGFVIYYLRVFKGGSGGDLYQREYDLQEGEQVLQFFSGQTVPEATAGDLAVAAVGFLETGEPMGVTGRSLNLVLTSANRMVIRIERDEPLHFGPDPRPTITLKSKHKRAKLRGTSGMEPVSMLEIEDPDIETLRIGVPESAVEPIVSWSTRGKGADEAASEEPAG